jgi:hypothetical protein
MNERQGEQLGAATGIVFVVLVVVSVLATPAPPDLDEQPIKVALWFTAHQDGIRAATFIGMLAAPFFLWFLGSLRGFLRIAEGGTGRLASITFAGGVVTAALATVGSTCLTVGALRPTNSPLILQTLADINFYVLAVGAFALAVYLAAGSLVILRRRVLPPWLGWVGLVSALLQLVTSFAIFGSTTGATNPKDGLFPLAGFVGFLFWTLAASILIASRTTPAVTARSAEISS